MVDTVNVVSIEEHIVENCVMLSGKVSIFAGFASQFWGIVYADFSQLKKWFMGCSILVGHTTLKGCQITQHFICPPATSKSKLYLWETSQLASVIPGYYYCHSWVVVMLLYWSLEFWITICYSTCMYDYIHLQYMQERTCIYPSNVFDDLYWSTACIYGSEFKKCLPLITFLKELYLYK